MSLFGLAFLLYFFKLSAGNDVFRLPGFLQMLALTADNIVFSQVHHLLTLKYDANKQNV